MGRDLASTATLGNGSLAALGSLSGGRAAALSRGSQNTVSPPEAGGGFWARLSLSQRFGLMGGVVMLVAMAVIGSWVSQRIEAGVVRNTAAATALYMESSIAPLSQELQRSERVSPKAEQALRSLFADTPLGERVISYKIWKKGGLIAHASRPELVGRVFEPTEELQAAWAGEVSAEFDDLKHEEDAAERATGLPLLEIYSPIRAAWSGEIIAVAEFYEVATGLQEDLFAARLNSWIMVAAVMLSMALLLFGIVHSGSRTIGRQRGELESQVRDLGRLAAQNDNLRQRVQRASARITELNERFLRRISAELHDGPAQLLGFASLRLGSLAPVPVEAAGAAAQSDEAAVVREALDEAMRQIRDVCRGLALPDLDGMSLDQVVRRAVEGHCNLSGTEVTLSNQAPADLSLSHPQKICVYRFVQEGLVNAFRHAGGKGQRVTLCRNDDRLEVAVSDAGPGFVPAEGRPAGNSGLGLAGLRERVESFGGKFTISSADGGGAVLTMDLPLDDGGTDGK